MSVTKGHCNLCGGERNHEVLHEEKTYWESDAEDGAYSVSGSDTYEMLKCAGCETITLRHTSWYSEYEEDDNVTYFPPAMFRKPPEWFTNLGADLKNEDRFVAKLLKEIYVAVQNNLPNLAAMGVRSLLEKIMISKTGDRGSFTKNIGEFERLGYVSRIQKERLEAILEAGHATIHRSFSPSNEDVITLVDLTEHIVETVYLHETRIEALKKRVPARFPKP